MTGTDRPMNNFAQVTDAEYVYAEDSNGNQVKIKKSDLLSIVFQSRGIIPPNGYNYCTLSGIYDIIGGANLPNGPTYGVDYGALLNFIGNTFAIQVIYEAFTTQRMLFRFRTDTWDWGSWVTFNHA